MDGPGRPVSGSEPLGQGKAPPRVDGVEPARQLGRGEEPDPLEGRLHQDHLGPISPMPPQVVPGPAAKETPDRVRSNLDGLPGKPEEGWVLPGDPIRSHRLPGGDRSVRDVEE